MKNMSGLLMRRYGLVLLFALFAAVSLIIHFTDGMEIWKNFRMFFMEMILFLPLMFILIGLFDVWVPHERIIRHVGPQAGIWGILWVVLLAMLQAGPLYAAFPMAALLWRKGCSIRNIFIYLGAFTTLKIPMLTFEVGFLGWKFSLLRGLLSFPVFIGVGFLMAAYLKDREFEVKDPS